MFCKICGKELHENAIVCPGCGCETGKIPSYVKECPSKKDKGSFWWGFLGFMFPLVGLILYIVWRDDYPKRGKSAGLGALISVITEVCVAILFALMYIFYYVFIFMILLSPIFYI